MNAHATSASVRERFFGPLSALQPWLESVSYRGCPFQNMMAEAPPDDARVRGVARRHQEMLRSFFRELTVELKAAEPELASVDPDKCADTYLLLFEGAIASAVAYQAAWPVEKAKASLETFLLRARGGSFLLCGRTSCPRWSASWTRAASFTALRRERTRCA